LFLIGPEEKKISNTMGTIEKLKSAFGTENVAICNWKSVISIYIAGVPRIVQLICTNYSKPNEVIDNFDLAHVTMYWDGKEFYVSPFAYWACKEKKVLPNPKCNNRAKLVRLIKYKLRGLDITDYVREFPFTKHNLHEISDKDREKQIYSETNNLTKKSRIKIGVSWNNAQRLCVGKIGKAPVANDDYTWMQTVNWSGNFKYLQQKEQFLQEDNLKIEIYLNDVEYYTGFVCKYSTDLSNNQKLYKDILVSGKITKLIKEFGGVSNGFYYVILNIEDEITIELVKNAVKLAVNDLSIGSEFLDFYETCILDSQFLTPEEKLLFNVKKFPHEKYKNTELTEAINQTVDSNGFYLFAPVYPENFNFQEDEVKVDTSEHNPLVKNLRKVKLDKLLTDSINKPVCFVTSIKNTRKGGINSVLSEECRAKTSLIVHRII